MSSPVRPFAGPYPPFGLSTSHFQSPHPHFGEDVRRGDGEIQAQDEQPPFLGPFPIGKAAPIKNGPLPFPPKPPAGEAVR